MADSAAIKAGRAYVEVFADLNPLARGLSKVESKFKGVSTAAGRIADRFTSVAASFGAAGAAITAPIALAVKSFIDLGSALDDMAQRTGATVEALSSLSYVAKLSGTDITAVEGGIRRMQRAIVEADNGSQSMAAALSRLGLSARELQSLSPDQQFARIAARIREIPDPARRAAAAMEIFGKTGTQLLPVMNQDVQALTAEAKKLGAVMSTEDAMAAAALGDAVDRATTAIQGAFTRVASALAGDLENIINKVAEVTAAFGKWVSENQNTVRVIALISTGVTGLAGAIGTVAVALKVFNVVTGIAGGAMAIAAGIARKFKGDLSGVKTEFSNIKDPADKAGVAASGFATGMDKAGEEVGQFKTNQVGLTNAFGEATQVANSYIAKLDEVGDKAVNTARRVAEAQRIVSNVSAQRVGRNSRSAIGGFGRRNKYVNEPNAPTAKQVRETLEKGSKPRVGEKLKLGGRPAQIELLDATADAKSGSKLNAALSETTQILGTLAAGTFGSSIAHLFDTILQKGASLSKLSDVFKAIGARLSSFGSIITKIGAKTLQFAKYGVLFNPYTIAFTTIALASGRVYEAIKDVVAVVVGLGTAFKNVFTKGDISGLITTIAKSFVLIMAEILNIVVKGVYNIGKGILNAGKYVWDGFIGILRPLSQISVDQLKRIGVDAINGFIQGLKSGAQQIIDFFDKLFDQNFGVDVAISKLREDVTGSKPKPAAKPEAKPAAKPAAAPTAEELQQAQAQRQAAIKAQQERQAQLKRQAQQRQQAQQQQLEEAKQAREDLARKQREAQQRRKEAQEKAAEEAEKRNAFDPQKSQSFFGDLQRQLAEIQQQRREVQGSTFLTRGQKAFKQRELDAQQQALFSPTKDQSLAAAQKQAAIGQRTNDIRARFEQLQRERQDILGSKLRGRQKQSAIQDIDKDQRQLFAPSKDPVQQAAQKNLAKQLQAQQLLQARSAIAAQRFSNESADSTGTFAAGIAGKILGGGAAQSNESQQLDLLRSIDDRLRELANYDDR